MSQQTTPAQSNFFIQLLIQTALTVGLTLLIFKYSPPETFKLQGKAGKPGASCEVKTVRYDPSGGAVLAFQCGKSVREVTIARGKAGPTGKAGAACTVSSRGASLVFQCGKERTTVQLPQAAAAPVPAPPTRRVAPPKRAVVVAPKRVAPPKRPVARPIPRRVAAPTPVARRTAPVASGKITIPAWGPATAKVKIVEFSDFQCPFCSRVIDTIKKLKKEFGDKVQVTFRHLPLKFHADAHLAAQASMAAHAQGKFWEYHDKLFTDTQKLKKPDLIRYAKQLGLDVARFTKELEAGKYKAHVDADLAAAARQGARGTPTFFINGTKVAGAYPYAYFKQSVEAVLRGEKVKPFAAPKQPKPGQPGQPKQPQFPVPDFNQVSVGKAPFTGSKDAKITIIEFSDFECGFCARAIGIIKRIKQTYGDKVRIAFKHMPLPFHKQAHLASQASMAAHEQGKFWEYHDKLFKNQQQLDRASLLRYAGELKLDLNRFNQALNSGRYKNFVNGDLQQGQGLRVRGTPTFFVNGYRIPGAFPFFYFKQVIEAVKAGKKPPAFKPPARQPTPPSDKPVTVNTINSPSVGPANAKVTIVEFSDFECSFCARAAKTIKKIKQHYGNQVRLVFKHVPLDNHPNAHIAAQASVEAHKQGKFWPFHELLFANYKSLSREKILALAKQVGMDVAKLQSALKSGEHIAKVNADNAEALRIGANNTPTFFVNGYRLMGARPEFIFHKAVEAALKGQNVGKAIQPRSEKSKEKVNIITNGAPSHGDKNAKVTIVEFSDFECGFCSATAKVIKRLRKEYPKRVRFVFKHLPLRFHKQAKPAAVASMAAHAQGKFWEYHDLLFENQKELGEKLYIKLAKQLKLDMAKFNSDRKKASYMKRVNNDYAEARWAGANGTPAFFINGRILVGAIPYERFVKVIKQATQEANNKR